MSLTPGTRLGVYEIIASIGVGGMGEVYRATDTTLGRQVAIKILPDAFASDPERLARFEREAKTLASLNHPHIAAIYGFEKSAGTQALVMELIEGPTLADRVAQGPISLDEALPMAKQIAEALEAAHEQGIVHRDLKPANIKVRPDGAVKVLDFGLAKAMEPTGAMSPNVSQSPTITTPAMTQAGMILGTAAYMSPEQARGQAIDKRTDIWAFGCVLYEMLTGRAAFARNTLTDTLAAVVERDPDRTLLPPDTPPSVTRLLARALTKDQKHRLRDVGDARHELESALIERSQSPAVVAPGNRGAVRLGRAAAALGLVAVGAGAGVLWSGVAPQPPTAPALGPLMPLTADSGLTTEPSISADGRLIVYASDRSGDGNLDIWVQQATGGSAIRLTTDPADDREPNVSPDGSLVAFRSERTPRGIYVVPALGGDARLIGPDGMMPRFSSDGRSIAFWTGQWLAPRGVASVRRTFVVPAAGGEVAEVAESLASAGDPAWSPDGSALIVFGRRATSGEGTDPDWWWVPLDDRPPVKSGVYERLLRQGLAVNDPNTQPYPLAWTAHGVLFSARNASSDDFGAVENAASRSIWRIPVDRQTGRVNGDASRLTHGTTTDTSAAISRDGRLVFAARSEHLLLFRLPLDANAGRVTGTLQRIRDDSATVGRAGASEDGRLLVFPRYEFGAGGVWIRDMATGREQQLTATPRTPLNPVISFDGRWVGYTVTKVNTGGTTGPGTGYVVEVLRGVPHKVCDDCQVWQWTRDNHVLTSEQGDTVLNQIDPATGTSTPVIAASFNIDRPFIAPNGRWIALNARERRGNDRGAPRVFVGPLYRDRPTTEREWISVHSRTGAERSAGLSPDGQLLYLLLERDGFRCLYAQRLDPATGHPMGEPFLVHHFHEAARYWGSTGFGSATVTGMFVAQLIETTGNIWMTTVEFK